MKLTKKLKKERAQKWADALVKNKGRENRGTFRNGRKRCCLCVAADVAAIELGKDAKIEDDGLPNQLVIDYYGWDFDGPELLGKHAAKWNDKDELSHAAIAKLVEAEFCI